MNVPGRGVNTGLFLMLWAVSACTDIQDTQEPAETDQQPLRGGNLQREGHAAFSLSARSCASSIVPTM